MKVETKTLSSQVAGLVAGLAAVVTTLMSFAFPVFAFAEEEESSGISVILPDMTEFIPMLIAFIVLVILLWKFGWPMFEETLDKREQAVKDSIEKAEAAQAESERVLAEYTKELEGAKAEAAQIIADAKQTGEAMKTQMIEEAQAQSDAMIEKARIAIENEKQAAIAELQGSVADMSLSVASRLIGEDLDDEEHRKIVERYVDEAGSFNAN